MKKISLIVPVFNEQETIALFYNAVRNHEALKPYTIEILFINDGSCDSTPELIDALSTSDSLVTAVHFTRNFGKEPALFAGLEYSTGDAVIPIDVDLQDPIEVIPLLIEQWQQGNQIVLAKRSDRSSDHSLKRKTAKWFYRIHNKISSPSIEENVGDFRLIDRETVDNILSLGERNLFMKGILSWVGGETAIVEYKRAERVAGNTKFNAWSLWNLAMEGITSFSTVPLRVWTYIGMLISSFSFLYGGWIIIDRLVWGNDVSGYASTIVSILILAGVQLIGIGVLGEYIGRIYVEVKQRPRYLVKKTKEKQK